MLEKTLPKNFQFLWALLGTLFVAFIGFVCVTRLSYHYFNQDDNFAQFTPNVVAGARSLLHQGVFPNWNPWVNLGSPGAVVGIYALTYPFTYMAVAVCDLLLHKPGLFPDVFFLLHLIPAVCVTFWLFFKASKSFWCASAGSLSCVFSGYFLIAGRSWYYMIPTMFYLPMLVGLTLYFNGTWKKILLIGFMNALYFHAGNAQMWLYTQFFLCVLVLFRVQQTDPLKRKKFTLSYVVSWIVGLGGSMPLLYAQAVWLKYVDRGNGFVGGDISSNLLSVLLPYPLVSSPHPRGWQEPGFYGETAGLLVYFGTAFAVSAVFLLTKETKTLIQQRSGYLRFSKQKIYTASVLMCMLLAFLLSLGKHGLLWSLLHSIGPLKKFSLPFKFIPFISFFCIFFSLLGMDTLGRKTVARYEKPFWFFSMVFLIPLFLFSKHAFYLYDNVYLSPPNILSHEANTRASTTHPAVRVWSKYPERSHDKTYSQVLPHNIASLWNISSIQGYEAFLSHKKGGRAVFKKAVQTYSEERINTEFGVEFILTHTGLGPPSIQQIPHPKPLVFSGDSTPLSYSVDFSGIHIEHSSAESNNREPITAAWIQTPFMVAHCDKKTLPVGHDEFGRIHVKPLAPWKTLDILYQPPWFTGCFLGFICIVFAIVLVRFYRL